MKKHVMSRVLAVVLAVAAIISPVTADAAEKKVVTREDFLQIQDEYLPDYGESDYDGYYNAIESLNGCYNKTGTKIYTVLNGATKKITKTGKYDFIVGGKTAKKDQGVIKFVAPKAGTYKFTFNVKTNVTGQNVCILPTENGFNTLKTDYYYTMNGKRYSDNTSGYLLLAASGSCTYYNTGTALDKQSGRTYSEMQTITGKVTLKKGESIVLTCRSPKAALNELDAYKFTDFVVSITKTK